MATEHGFFTPGVAEHEGSGAEHEGSGIDAVTGSGAETSAKKQQHQGHEAQQRSIDEMLTFLNWVCDMNPSSRAHYNSLYGVILRYLD